MIPASNISANLEYRLNKYPGDNDLYHVVVQKRQCWFYVCVCFTTAS